MKMPSTKNKKIRIKTPLYGKKVFANKNEYNYYKLYKKLKLDKKFVLDLHQAVGRCDGHIPLTNINEEVEAWQYLIDTGMCYRLGSYFEEQAMTLINIGVCKNKIIH
jgi:hypothetical protein|tara:strand:+ start:682 stop:1002 length:321 start_codon:yes stop_codon:yes gene_type:complete